MSLRLNVTAICAVLLTAPMACCQGPLAISSERTDGFADLPVARAALLELRVGADAASLELVGGRAGALAVLALGAPADGGTQVAGRFDAEGRFAVPFGAAARAGTSLHAQGFECDAATERALWASNGLRVRWQTAAASGPAPLATSGADLSLLRIELPENHGGLVRRELAAHDLVGALAAALNSHGDRLRVKLGGKVLVPVVSPLSVGGTVAFTATISREHDEYLIAIGSEVALLCGVKASDDVGVEGGVSLGSDCIYRFQSASEAARGLLAIAMVQALPATLHVATGDNLARLRQARARLQSVQRALAGLRASGFARGFPCAGYALERARQLAVRAFAPIRRAGDVLEQLTTEVVALAQLVRDHTDGTETRASVTGEASLKIGGKDRGKVVGAELGGSLGGAWQVTVRTFQGWQQPVRSYEVTAGHSVAVTLAAALKLGKLGEGGGEQANEAAFSRGFEVSLTTTRQIVTTVEIVDGAPGTPVVVVQFRRELELPMFARETVFEIAVEQLGAAAADLVAAAASRDAAGAVATFADFPVRVTVQDRRTLALQPEFGLDKGVVAQLQAELAWTDAGDERAGTITLRQVFEGLQDLEARAAEVRALVEQVRALPQ